VEDERFEKPIYVGNMHFRGKGKNKEGKKTFLEGRRRKTHARKEGKKNERSRWIS